MSFTIGGTTFPPPALDSISSSSNDSEILRIGVLSVARIAYLGLVEPVSTHASSVITAIASRDQSKADEYIRRKKTYLTGKCTAYGSYDELLNNPHIDAVFIPLPNSLHHQFALAALKKGKHIMIEKPIASNAQQAREIRAAAIQSGKVALEAFHWRFHPAAGCVKSLLLSGEYGAVLSIDARYAMFGGMFNRGEDIRFKYELAGGSCMDLTYVFSAIAYLGVRDSCDPDFEFEVLDSKFRLSPYDPLVDEQVEATILLSDPHPYGCNRNSRETGAPPSQIRATVGADLHSPPFLGIIPRFWDRPMLTIQTEKAEITFDNFMGPWISHSIAITAVTRDPTGQRILRRGKKIQTACYQGGPLWEQEESRTGAKVGEAWWTTWRYQLEGFVRRVKDGEAYAGPWVTLDESVRTMEMIDAVYAKGGLPVRGA
ncbi:uncharacterized protein A1O9_04906 [Exophiala aquamarina CBS 119918]|uniref:D-xylose 1-dehydrogenase (NADP(+), D-xylono-1,5-lactone-forming) n=1 Tax=Exophiala aquamarina CBS 119918 TaxID=1182545 RepID=A0A072PJI7_9EURO|nr:uncharacterized protein A1O9_04906 [Exophiala aquamarina CBS 119918]KEF60056.1 hypothetical protein A1O9_04906 [Exophiala aquamarina CBS 119918]